MNQKLVHYYLFIRMIPYNSGFNRFSAQELLYILHIDRSSIPSYYDTSLLLHTLYYTFSDTILNKLSPRQPLLYPLPINQPWLQLGPIIFDK